MASVILSAGYAHQQSHKSTHYHDCHQIIYIARGSASIQMGSAIHTARAGHLVIFSRFEQHAVTSRSSDYERYVLHIDPHIPSGAENGQRLFSILSNRPAGFSNILDFHENADEIVGILQRITREKEHQNLLGDEMLNLLMQELLICIYRHFPEPFSVINEDFLEIVYLIQSRFETNYQERFVLAELAEEYGFSVSYLSHVFKKITGHSVMGYLLSCRIAAAKKYLAETTMGIGQIVENCGFSDSSNFSRSFKQFTGCSPTKFRQKYQ